MLLFDLDSHGSIFVKPHLLCGGKIRGHRAAVSILSDLSKFQ